jgi:hypothetical protein
MAENYKFPDEVDDPIENQIEIEIEDDTPEEDRRNAIPLPEEIVKDIEDDDLESYSKEAKQRLLQMKKLINDERRAKEQAYREQSEAVRVAQTLLERTKELQKNLSQGEKVLVNNAQNSATNELDFAKKEYKEAYDSGDSDRLVEAQTKLTSAQYRAAQLAQYRPQYDENALQNWENSVQIQQPQPQPQRLDPKTQAWLDKNSWYGSDEDMSFLAMGVHRRLEKEGVPPGSDHYWNVIDNEMRKRFPDKFSGESQAETKDSASRRSNTVVAPATRSTASKKVKLTQTQLALAKKFKLTPEQYAVELTKVQESQNG